MGEDALTVLIIGDVVETRETRGETISLRDVLEVELTRTGVLILTGLATTRSGEGVDLRR